MQGVAWSEAIQEPYRIARILELIEAAFGPDHVATATAAAPPVQGTPGRDSDPFDPRV